MKTNNNPHRGSRLRDLLAADGLLEKVETNALKRAVALQFAQAVNEAALSKQEIARRMKTSRAALDRLLDPANSSATLNTLEKAAHVRVAHSEGRWTGEDAVGQCSRRR